MAVSDDAAQQQQQEVADRAQQPEVADRAQHLASEVSDPVELATRVIDTEEELRAAEEENQALLLEICQLKDAGAKAGQRLASQEENIERLHAKQAKMLDKAEKLRDPLN